MRTAGCILGISSYIIAKQLIETGKLDSFGLPMANLAMSSALTLADALKKLCLPLTERDTEPDTSTTRQAPSPITSAVQNVASALSLAGSSGLLSNWVLNKQAGDTDAANVKSLIVPVAFANAAIFKLVLNSGAVPNKALPPAKCIALTGMMLGSALFAELALTEREDIALFAVSCALCAGLLPQTLIAIRDVFLALSNRETGRTPQNAGEIELTNDTRHTAITVPLYQK
ncbi:MAG: hypothetical protein LW710_13045 [Burkholderiales bacterium]|uniref:hypothetical protein n=1 Tax=Limnobacter sp. TaxID=2003368 RepID=UPI0039BD8056|nr:hypothetical protein [Burkholderiales bacterium]